MNTGIVILSALAVVLVLVYAAGIVLFVLAHKNEKKRTLFTLLSFSAIAVFQVIFLFPGIFISRGDIVFVLLPVLIVLILALFLRKNKWMRLAGISVVLSIGAWFMPYGTFSKQMSFIEMPAQLKEGTQRVRASAKFVRFISTNVLIKNPVRNKTELEKAISDYYDAVMPVLNKNNNERGSMSFYRKTRDTSAFINSDRFPYAVAAERIYLSDFPKAYLGSISEDENGKEVRINPDL